MWETKEHGARGTGVWVENFLVASHLFGPLPVSTASLRAVGSTGEKGPEEDNPWASCGQSPWLGPLGNPSTHLVPGTLQVLGQ